MKKFPVVIFGVSGHAKVILDIIQGPTIVTGAAIGFGNTIGLLDKDSAVVTIAL